MKRNLVGKILGKIKIFVQDFVPIRTALYFGIMVDVSLMIRNKNDNLPFENTYVITG